MTRKKWPARNACPRAGAGVFGIFPGPLGPVARSLSSWRCVFFALAFSGLTLVGLGGCAAVQEGREDAQVVLRGVPHGSVIRVDGRAVGTSHEAEVALPVRAGTRRLELAHPDYLAWRMDLELSVGERLVVEIELWPRFEEVDRALESLSGRAAARLSLHCS